MPLGILEKLNLKVACHILDLKQSLLKLENQKDFYVDCGEFSCSWESLFSVLAMMMYTHPVSSPHSISCLLILLPVHNGGVSQVPSMTEISEVNILSEIQIYLT